MRVGAQNITRKTVNIVVVESTGVQDNGTTYFVRYLNPLLELAMKDSQEKFGEFIDIRMRHVEALSGISQVGAVAAREYYTGEVDVFFGTGRSSVLLLR
ncbi:atrial natriuretic peptide receptor 1 [Biomphalaria pfeifferi]|uniref:Atrial natriuretic peptide receptor 1 n=1 Tax=Biomphalaria pfeifferi TaxID=112525 RepID=A0AAD8BSB5_BIOPF|nr:atrial natriuretic peptide receptor 1 [Biomphalaria pfeifferi]